MNGENLRQDQFLFIITNYKITAMNFFFVTGLSFHNRFNLDFCFSVSLPNPLNSQFVDVQFNESFEINGVVITFLPAGHMLGSAQILMEFAQEKYLYTGDFKLQSDESCEPFQFAKCDHLITETTFADPANSIVRR